jgi:hypothetical protein
MCRWSRVDVMQLCEQVSHSRPGPTPPRRIGFRTPNAPARCTGRYTRATSPPCTRNGAGQGVAEFFPKDTTPSTRCRECVWMLHICTHPPPHLRFVLAAIYAAPCAMTCVRPASNAAPRGTRAKEQRVDEYSLGLCGTQPHQLGP